MAQLPKGLPLELMQTRWKSQIDPLLANPVNSVSFLKNIALNNGSTVINHLLGRKMQGWFVLDIDGAGNPYRDPAAPFNATTLTLISSAACNVNLGVF